VKRREFIAAIGGMAVWQLAAYGQSSDKTKVGFLSSRSPGESASVVAAFRQRLNEVGFVEGQNLEIEFRWAEGQYNRLPILANEIVAQQQIALIAATGDSVSALAAKGATPTIPIVFVVGGDPVRFGLVASLNRPGGNITGVSLISNGLGAKRLGLLHAQLGWIDGRNKALDLNVPHSLLARADEVIE
jgi:putative ABC transport system substrate-binding protein